MSSPSSLAVAMFLVVMATTSPSAHQITNEAGQTIDYTDWEHRGVDCCGSRDCQPAPYRLNPATLEEEVCPGSPSTDRCLPPGKWRPIDRQALMPGSSPDNNAHVCTASGSPTGYMRCVKLPAQGV